MPIYRNFVFKGGGVRGVAYLGALKYIYENGLMRSVERVAGTSAGAITAAILALNFRNHDSIKTIGDSLDYRKVPAEGDLSADQAKSLGVFKSLQCSMRLVQAKGWYSSDYLYTWLKSVVAGQFASIPFQYPGTSKPQFYADGGVMWNYPISVFDDPKYGKKLSRGINAETLGFFIYTSPEATDYKEVKGLIDYVGALFESLLLVQEQLVLYGEKSRERTIFINDQGVPMTNFNIALGDAVYRKLYASGYEAAREFFAEKANWDIILHKVQTRFGWRKTEY